ncbi:hypothetical protein E2C01_078290 [Portunus trituberculatus]|uniref:Uncharacterized protein n=1 Tax=Portunus trituberculatus TaxID=210409 RepID=A0A5B7ISC4_PORTR|nr:hypothetical protein [Portunus trituberculatus]
MEATLRQRYAALNDPPKRRCLWRFASARWGDLRRYYADFPWNDYCFCVRDPSLCTERITETFAHNSTFDDSGLAPPSPPPSDYFMSKLKFFVTMFSMPSLAYGPDVVPPIVLKNCGSVLAPCHDQTLLTLSIYFYLPFLLEVCLHSACS